MNRNFKIREQDYKAMQGMNERQAEGTNVYETESFECGKASVETVVSFQIYGSMNSGTGKLSGGGYIGSNTVNLKVNGGFGTQKFEVKNSSGRVVGSATSGQCMCM